MSMIEVTAPLDDRTVARIDTLARQHGITRDQMLARIVTTGLLQEERQVRETRARSGRGAR